MKVVHATARKHIPRGCRKNYVPGLTTDLAEQYSEYIQLYEQDPFSADTITAGDELAQALTVEQRKTWQALIENTDMMHNSKKAWSLIKKLSNDPRKADHVNVTPNQVAHQLVLNGKVPNRQRQSKIKRRGQENHDFDDDFSIVELQNSLKHLKNGIAAGLDEILTEEIQELRTHNNEAGTEPVQRVRKITPLTETLETGTCCCPSETRKGPIEPEMFQTNFPFVSPLQTVRAPDTEPPVSYYRTFPCTRAGC